ncbi:unnamed protein product [Paramecium sonneborni]|uniref:Peptidase C1A papain C-terminal domain-containing protein n=1 Tax=Paramecium sonneborni TaxID=65129 RepID=A0A8S1RLM7_9CILI|nr:unnamed protein product [Paramecium sonneborni]
MDGKNFLTYKRNENSPQFCNASWSFAVTGALSDRIKIKSNVAFSEIVLSPLVLISCDIQSNGFILVLHQMHTSKNKQDQLSYIFKQQYIWISDETCTNYVAHKKNAIKQLVIGTVLMEWNSTWISILSGWMENKWLIQILDCEKQFGSKMTYKNVVIVQCRILQLKELEIELLQIEVLKKDKLKNLHLIIQIYYIFYNRINLSQIQYQNQTQTYQFNLIGEILMELFIQQIIGINIFQFILVHVVTCCQFNNI